MKKITIVLAMVLSLSLVGCGNKEVSKTEPQSVVSTESVEQEQTSQEEFTKADEVVDEKEELPVTKEKTIDNITVGIENVNIENDTLNIEWKIANNSNGPYGYINYLEIKDQDGNEIDYEMDLLTSGYNPVAPGESKVLNLNIPLNGEIPTSITASYAFYNYTEEYWEDLGKAISGELTEKEYTSKYSEPKIMEFSIEL